VRSSVVLVSAQAMPQTRTRRRGAKLAGVELFTAMDAKISSLGDAGLAILELMDHYDIDLDDLRRFSLGNDP
jgi:hypothetical protein